METTLALINGVPPSAVGVQPWAPPQSHANVTNKPMIGRAELASLLAQDEIDNSQTTATTTVTGDMCFMKTKLFIIFCKFIQTFYFIV